eukprot:s4557_g2.t1
MGALCWGHHWPVIKAPYWARDHQCTPPTGYLFSVFAYVDVRLSHWSHVNYNFPVAWQHILSSGPSVSVQKSDQHLWCFEVRVDRRWACTLTRATV